MGVRWPMTDVMEVAKGKIVNHRIPRPKGLDMAIFVGGKLAFFTLALAIPMLAGHPWWVALPVFVGVTLLPSLIMSVVFQLAHCVEEADFPLPKDGTEHMANCWAAHQVETTVDFARKSRIACWYLGGLNFQTVHHLFPRICHVHYPAVATIVEDTSREFGVRYSAHASFAAGMASHVRWLKKMGRPDPAMA